MDTRLAYFSLFNSKLPFADQDYLSTDMNTEKLQESNEAPQTTADSLTINDEEAKRILGTDLADLILAKSSTDSVSCFGPVIPKTNIGVR